MSGTSTPPAATGPVAGLARLQQRLADRGASQQLGSAVRASTSGSRARGPAGVAAVLLATGVHVVTVGIATTGVLVAWQALWLVKPLGVVMVLVAVAVSPRLSHDPDDVELGPQDAPALFALLERVAAHQHAPVPHVVRLDTSFNASASGNRRRVLGLGAPLWAALGPQARVALLGHELGHFAHRDLLDGWWIGRAAISLNRWVWLVDDRQDEGWSWLVGTGGNLSQGLLSIVYAPLRWTATGLLRVLVLLDARGSRGREHLADLAAIGAGGTDGARDMLHTTLSLESVHAALTRAALGPRRGEPWEVVREALEAVGEDGRRNRARAADREQARIDDTHPLTTLRLRLVDTVPDTSAGVVVDAGEQARLDDELAVHLDGLGAEIVEAIRWTT